MEIQEFHPLGAWRSVQKMLKMYLYLILNNIKTCVLGLRPKRTLRLVLWTGEEQGGVGAEQYYQLHKVNMSLHHFKALFSPVL